MSTSTTVLSANQSVAVPLLTINGWILMQRKVTGGAVSFNQPWIDYRDGFGTSTSDNYWLGLEKVYRLMQRGNVRLRIEVNTQLFRQPDISRTRNVLSLLLHFLRPLRR